MFAYVGHCFLLLLLTRSVVSSSLVTPGTVAHQAPLSMGFPRQKYWSGLPFPFPGDFPDPRIEPESPALAGAFFTTEPPFFRSEILKFGNANLIVSDILECEVKWALESITTNKASGSDGIPLSCFKS